MTWIYVETRTFYLIQTRKAKRRLPKPGAAHSVKAELLPIVRITLHMTHLLLNPCWGSAWHDSLLAGTGSQMLQVQQSQSQRFYGTLLLQWQVDDNLGPNRDSEKDMCHA